MAKHTGDKILNQGSYIKDEFIDCVASIKFNAGQLTEYYLENCKCENLLLKYIGRFEILISCNKGKIIIQKAGKKISILIENVDVKEFVVHEHIQEFSYDVKIIGSKAVTKEKNISFTVYDLSIVCKNSDLSSLICVANNFSSLDVRNCKLENYIINNISREGKVNLNLFAIQNVDVVALQFERILFPKEFELVNCNLGTLAFTECNIPQEGIWLNDDHQDNSRYVKKISLYNNIYSNDLQIYSGEKPYEDIDIMGSEKSSGKLTLNRLTTKSVVLGGLSNNSQMVLEDIMLEHLTLIYLSSNERIILNRFFNRKNLFTLNIMHSHLKNIDLLNVDIYTLTILDSVLKDFNSINVKWPKKVHFKNEDDFSSIRNIYLQLKGAMFAQNDKIQALRFEALEMQAYKSELFPNKWWQIKKWNPRNRLNDKIVLLAGWTNGYGQSWSRALLLYLLLVAPLLALSLAYSISHTITLERFWLSYFAVINPTHSLNELIKSIIGVEIVTVNVIIADLSARIIAAFFYFQIISAFRKYAKG